jgi:hypothetical protein
MIAIYDTFFVAGKVLREHEADVGKLKIPQYDPFLPVLEIFEFNTVQVKFNAALNIFHINSVYELWKGEFRNAHKFMDPLYANISCHNKTEDVDQHFTVLANHGKVFLFTKTTSIDINPIWSARCPNCEESGMVYAIGADIKCGSCDSKLILTGV